MLDYPLFAIGFVILIKGADLMVDGASSIAKKLNLSDMVIGLTIVAFGTSAPEFIVNIFASIDGRAGIAIGNIVGSNVANIFLILGATSIIYPIAVKRNTLYREIPFSFLAALVLFIFANDVLIDGNATSAISRGDGLTFLAFFVIFLYYVYSLSKKGKDDDVEQEIEEIKELAMPKAILFVLLGITGLFFGGNWIVVGASKIAKTFGMSENVIGLTIVAFGTSLPELATSILAALKKNTDIAMGNVIGSNIFNIFWVLGCSSVIKTLPISNSSNLDLYVLLFASLLLFLFLFIGKRYKFQRWQGVSFVLMYISYMTYLVISA